MTRSERDTAMRAATTLSVLAKVCEGFLTAAHIAEAKAASSDLLLIANGKKPASKGKPAGRTVATWNAYSAAYMARYEVMPIRNKKVNGMLAQLLELVGDQDAPRVAAFYVEHNRGLYVSSHHAIELLIRDCDGLRTQMLNGRRVTDTSARGADRQQATHDSFAPLIADAEAKERRFGK